MRNTSLIILLVVIASLYADNAQFKATWYDGNAEISTYAMKEMRYGELRPGKRVMVFVTEPMRIASHLKPDAKLPDSAVVNVLKLNDLRQFNTGVYQYNVMTSVYSAVEDHPPLTTGMTLKAAFSAQEWCGTVFERLIRAEDQFQGTFFSYFESEGEGTYSFPHNDTVEVEDNLLILVRELTGPSMPDTYIKKMRIIPSMWERRKSHTPVSLATCSLRKQVAPDMKTAIGDFPVAMFSWDVNGREIVVLVEKAWPHRILSWHGSDGSSGTISATKRIQYWSRHANKDEYLRRELMLEP
jgi:hypothetical protein